LDATGRTSTPARLEEELMTVAEVNAVAQAFHDGVANQDAAALASLYTQDGRFLPPDMEPCEGRATKVVLDIFNSNLPAAG
jgi:ketosteroid isomerase-like protein